MSAHLIERRKGLLFAALGGMALSVDIPLVRLTNGDLWSVQLLRSIIVICVTLMIYGVVRFVLKRQLVLIPGLAGLVVAALYGLSTLTFFYAVFSTSTANLVFILAFNPMFAALFGWLIIGERPKPATFLTMIAMTAGVFIIVEGGFSGGHVLGDLSALASAASMALAITISRASGKEMGFAALLSAVVPAIVAGYVVFQQGGIVAQSPGWIVVNGAIIMPVAFFCLAVAPRFISGTHVGMFYLLETILAPVWVWMIFKEAPSSQTLIGGTILLAALMAHTLWELNQDRLAARLPAASG